MVRGLPRLRRSGGYVGMAGLAIVLLLDVASVRLFPWWLSVLLGVFWLVLFGAAARRFETRPLVVFWLPIAGLAVWLTLVLVGTLVWGWRA